MSATPDGLLVSVGEGAYIRSFHPQCNLVFAGPFGEEVGRLTWEGGTFRFAGNVDESAKVFFDALKRMGIARETNLTSSQPDDTTKLP
jgi:hypothetical protein